ncbi:YwiC-like family protein [Aneurinibacillus terranovensis]|uniref:YwiC-like family protein n=1 Tax=Aneurinibacillus terranovensis TaxID=278991 RepID=UPI00042A28BC|nr:YwiC-like family protein [Aneurinibacillus terranovensis]
MKPIIPKQHGAWAMLTVPFLVGMAAGGAKWIHIPLFLGCFFLYLASYPLLLAVKNRRRAAEYIKWIFIYGILGAAFLILPVYDSPNLMWFGIIVLPLFFVNFYYAKQKNERAFLNDFCAVAELSLGGPASYYAATGTIDKTAILVWILCVLFFTGSVFYVKTLLREKKNATFKWFSWGYHLGVPFIVGILGATIIAVAFIPSLIRAVICYGKPLTPKTVGIIEIANSIFFVIVLFIGMHIRMIL